MGRCWAPNTDTVGFDSHRCWNHHAIHSLHYTTLSMTSQLRAARPPPFTVVYAMCSSATKEQEAPYQTIIGRIWWEMCLGGLLVPKSHCHHLLKVCTRSRASNRGHETMTSCATCSILQRATCTRPQCTYRTVQTPRAAPVAEYHPRTEVHTRPTQEGALPLPSGSALWQWR
jgi:hypothetical protein